MKRNELFVGSCLLVCAAGTTLAIASPAPTPVRTLNTPGNVVVPGIDVAISSIAASRSSATKDILIYNQGSASVTDLPAGSGMFAMSMQTTSCNQQPNNGPPTARIASGSGITAGSPFWLADWYSYGESGPNWDGTALGAAAGNRHPYIASAVYRLNAAGRLEQLSQSWAKHSWSAASGSQPNVAGASGSDICGTGTCLNLSTDNQLEANCADTYGSGLNADQFWMGPRNEIAAFRPWNDGTAANSGWNNPGWNRIGSYFDSYTNNETLVANVAQRTDGTRNLTGGTMPAYKINMVRYDEVNQAALGPSGRVIMEGYYVVNGDNYQLNNVAHRVFTSNVADNASTVSSSNFNFASRQIWGPAVLQWGEQKSVADPQTEGEVYVSSRAVNLGNGTWRYEYNVYNHNLDRQLNSFEVPVPSFATKTDFGFHQPRATWLGYDKGAWTATYDAAKKAVVWTPPAATQFSDTELAAMRPQMPAGTVMKSNTIRWGGMYSFWFTSNLDPRSDAGSKMGMELPGTVAGQLSAEVRAPRHPADVGVQGGTAGSDGQLDNNDFISFIDLFFNADVRADLGQQGGLPGADAQFDNNDFIVFIDYFFQS